MRLPADPPRDTAETLHGHQVADPYRWLEDPDSEETRAWVAAQNQAARAHLDGLASRPWFLPHHAGGGRPAARRAPGQGRRPLRREPQRRHASSRTSGSSGHPRRAPARRAGCCSTRTPSPPTARSSLAGYHASRDGRWLAYLVSDGGSDWTTVRLLDLAAGREVDDVVSKVKFSEATWLPDHSSYLYLLLPHRGHGRRHRGGGAARRAAAQALRRRVAGHRRAGAGVPGRPAAGHHRRGSPTTAAGWRCASHEGTSEKNRLWVYPVTTDGGASDDRRAAQARRRGVRRLRPRALRRGRRLLPAHRPRGAAAPGGATRPRRRSPPPDAWTSSTWCRSPSTSLEHVEAVGEELLVVHLVDVQPRLSRCALDGDGSTRSTCPAAQVVALHGDVGRRRGVPRHVVGDRAAATAYRLDLGSGEVTAPRPGAGRRHRRGAARRSVTERRRATSKDGTEVPYFLRPAADLPPTDRGPTLLWGYGGFEIPDARDLPARLVVGWLAAGGVLAIANLRGGGEFGTGVARRGPARAQAERLRRLHRRRRAPGRRRASPRRGSWRCTAAATAACWSARRSPSGPTWRRWRCPPSACWTCCASTCSRSARRGCPTTASPDDPEMFEVLLAYSPLHNVEPGTAYPATLVLTGDHDDRVVPAHSFKFTAALQHAQGGDAPVLARIETAAGHGAGQAAARWSPRRPPTCSPSPPSTPAWSRRLTPPSRRDRHAEPADPASHAGAADAPARGVASATRAGSARSRRGGRPRRGPPCPSRAPLSRSDGLELDHPRAQRLVGGGQDADGEQAGVAGVADRDRRDRHAGRHLHDGEQRVHAVEVAQRHRHADHRQRRDARRACPGRWAAPPAPAMITCRPAAGGVAAVGEHLVGHPVRRDDVGLEGDAELVERLGGGLHRRPVRVGAHHDADDAGPAVALIRSPSRGRRGTRRRRAGPARARRPGRRRRP